MEDSGDAEILSAEAPADPALVAGLILCSFRHASPPAPSPATVDLSPAWGCHAPRSERRIGDNTDAVASSRRVSNKNEAAAWRRRRRRSPMTPLEHRGGSGVSESCSEEMLVKRSEIGGLTGGVIGPETKVSISETENRSASGSHATVVVAGELELSVFRITDSKPIRRSPAKKKLTLPELEAMHQSLLEHRKFLLKELQVKRKSKVVLVARNQELKKLKMRLESRKRPNTVPVPEEVHPKRVRLPDLNIPFVL